MNVCYYVITFGCIAGSGYFGFHNGKEAGISGFVEYLRKRTKKDVITLKITKDVFEIL